MKGKTGEGKKQRGRASIVFETPPMITAAASTVGKKEGDGPLGTCFDRVELDHMLGKKTWEEAESELQSRTAGLVIEKSGLSREEIRYSFAGDLLAQLIATSFGNVNLEIPMFGLYGACSTMGEGLGLGAMCVEGGFADHVLVSASSHFASAEKQFRFPLEYGNQRPYSATWTVTGCGAVIVSSGSYRGEEPPLAKITAVTTGKIVDMDFHDSMNMGAAMAMAALGVEHALCSEPVVVDEHYTGELWRTAIGEHKALHAQRYAQERGQPLAACYAFGDHISDLPLLALVGNPCAVNPCAALLAESQRRGWPVLWSTVD